MATQSCWKYLLTIDEAPQPMRALAWSSNDSHKGDVKMDALEQFVDRFAAGAGSNYTWCLDEGCLTAKVPAPFPLPPGYEDYDYVRLCPISAESTLEHGTVCYSWEYQSAAYNLGLDFGVTWKITQASDREFSPRDSELTQLRARLLRICGVEEEAE